MMLHTKYQGSIPSGFESRHFYVFTTSVHVKHMPLGHSFIHSPQNHYLNKIGKIPLSDATYKLSKLYALWYQIR